jgi:hypothetical protein
VKLDLDRIIEIARRYPDQVHTLPVIANLRGVELVRANRKNPDAGILKIALPDEWVKQLTGAEEFVPLLFCIYIPRHIVDIAESRLVLPGLDASTKQPTRKRSRRP